MKTNAVCSFFHIHYDVMQTQHWHCGVSLVDFFLHAHMGGKSKIISEYHPWLSICRLALFTMSLITIQCTDVHYGELTWYRDTDSRSACHLRHAYCDLTFRKEIKDRYTPRYRHNVVQYNMIFDVMMQWLKPNIRLTSNRTKDTSYLSC